MLKSAYDQSSAILANMPALAGLHHKTLYVTQASSTRTMANTEEHSYWPSKHAPELTSSRVSARGALAFRGFGRTRDAEELQRIAIRRSKQRATLYA